MTILMADISTKLTAIPVYAKFIIQCEVNFSAL